MTKENTATSENDLNPNGTHVTDDSPRVENSIHTLAAICTSSRAHKTTVVGQNVEPDALQSKESQLGKGNKVTTMTHNGYQLILTLVTLGYIGPIELINLFATGFLSKLSSNSEF